VDKSDRVLFQRTKVKVKQSRNRPGVGQRLPGGLGSQISWYSARESGEVISLTHRPPLPPGMFLQSFSIGAESTPGPWYGRKEICHRKIQWHHRESIPGPSDHYATLGPIFNVHSHHVYSMKFVSSASLLAGFQIETPKIQDWDSIRYTSASVQTSPPLRVKKIVLLWKSKAEFFFILSDEKRKKLFWWSGHFETKNKKSIPVC